MPRDNEDHPILTPKEDAAQRGDDPPGSFGSNKPADGGLEPNWQPNDDTKKDAEEFIRTYGKERRPHREDVYPYLLIRAYSPGDRGARPTWPPIPCWESPDLLLIDASYTGPFDPAQLVGNPTSGRRYRVFVRVWNLGLLPAIGVHVRAWYVNPGFFGGDPSNPAYQPHLIGGAMVNLDDRTRPGAMQVVELDRTWDIPVDLTGHECLMATASCPLDQWGGALDSNHDRHVGQRNLTILAGADEAKSLLFTLGEMVTKTGTLELVHGGAAVVPVLRALLGKARSEFGPVQRLRAPVAKALKHGVAMGDAGTHLLTMFQTDRGWLVADSERVWAAALERGLVKPQRPAARGQKPRDAALGAARNAPGIERGVAAGHPFARPLATRRLLEEMGPDVFEKVGVLIDRGQSALVEGIARLWDVGDLTAHDLAAALAEGGPFAHLLRFSHVDPETKEAGGYSVTIIG
ncbi:hypothetical protein G5T42_11130 [Microbacterium sp. 4R-513]|uniref:hypothetical protein n=1 Tax=Microbacterium sp. 4R-513 TaxID=2567934 RepID=UPI0013E1E707|nr:hypothetical protein [Microbacterium sp. 4R-513]QIG39967.1 hypothetical protein G5T42_11130 [Microbacterium sp. 4R-513]